MAATTKPAAGDEPVDPIGELIEQLGASVAAEYQGIENNMLEAVTAELRAGNLGNPATAARLAAQGHEVAEQIDTEETARVAVGIAIAAGAAAVVASNRGGSGGGFGSRRPVATPDGESAGRALVLQFTADLDSMTANIERFMPDAYRTASSYLTLADQQEAIAERYLAKGITGKVYANGARMPIGSYAEMVARTITAQAATIGAQGQMRSDGINLCTIAVGSDACSSCAANIGKVFSLDGTPAGVYTFPNALTGAPTSVTVTGTLASASSGKSHYRGPNCRCTIQSYQAGLGIATGQGWSREAEAERDRQRLLERNIRQWKARELTALTPETATAAGRRVRAAQAQMREFVADTGRVRNRYREQLAFSVGPIPTTGPRPFVQ